MKTLISILFVALTACGSADSANMPKTEVYRITSQEAPQLTQEVNTILSRISDRLDKVEGIRSQSNINFSRLVRKESSILQTGIIFQPIIPGAVTVNLGQVEAGDKILVEVTYIGTKAVSSGDLLSTITNFGTSTIDYGAVGAPDAAKFLPNVTNGTLVTDSYTAFGTVRISGTAIIVLQCLASAGSMTATVSMYVAALRNSD